MYSTLNYYWTEKESAADNLDSLELFFLVKFFVCTYALVVSSLLIFVHWKLHIVVYFEKEIPRKCNHHCNSLQFNDVQKVVFFEHVDTHRKNT